MGSRHRLGTLCVTFCPIGHTALFTKCDLIPKILLSTKLLDFMTAQCMGGGALSGDSFSLNIADNANIYVSNMKTGDVDVK